MRIYAVLTRRGNCQNLKGAVVSWAHHFINRESS